MGARNRVAREPVVSAVFDRWSGAPRGGVCDGRQLPGIRDRTWTGRLGQRRAPTRIGAPPVRCVIAQMSTFVEVRAASGDFPWSEVGRGLRVSACTGGYPEGWATQGVRCPNSMFPLTRLRAAPISRGARRSLHGAYGTALRQQCNCRAVSGVQCRGRHVFADGLAQGADARPAKGGRGGGRFERSRAQE